MQTTLSVSLVATEVQWLHLSMIHKQIKFKYQEICSISMKKLKHTAESILWSIIWENKGTCLLWSELMAYKFWNAQGRRVALLHRRQCETMKTVNTRNIENDVLSSKWHRHTWKKIGVLLSGVEPKTFRLLVRMLYHLATGDLWGLRPVN